MSLSVPDPEPDKLDVSLLIESLAEWKETLSRYVLFSLPGMHVEVSHDLLLFLNRMGDQYKEYWMQVSDVESKYMCALKCTSGASKLGANLARDMVDLVNRMAETDSPSQSSKDSLRDRLDDLRKRCLDVAMECHDAASTFVELEEQVNAVRHPLSVNVGCASRLTHNM